MANLKWQVGPVCRAFLEKILQGTPHLSWMPPTTLNQAGRDSVAELFEGAHECLEDGGLKWDPDIDAFKCDVLPGKEEAFAKFCLATYRSVVTPGAPAGKLRDAYQDLLHERPPDPTDNEKEKKKLRPELARLEQHGLLAVFPYIDKKVRPVRLARPPVQP